jgi:2,4-dienoyl-CoA reductase-like NADH-dependent reductase (Old Yellow Enzyme family)
MQYSFSLSKDNDCGMMRIIPAWRQRGFAISQPWSGNDVISLMQRSRCLFEPLSLGGITLANRIAVSPMCQYSAEEGVANDWHLQHLGSLSLSGAALVIVEQTAVEPAGRISHGCLGLYSDANEAALARVVGFCRRAGSAALGIQLAHAGRKGSARLPWEGGGPLARDTGAWNHGSAIGDPF